MPESPYRRGGADGLRFGIYLAVMFFASIFSSSFAPLGLLSMAQMVAVPAVTYVMMRRYQRSLGAASSFSMLWMYGLVLFFCGMLIAAAPLTIYMRWIEPGFILGQLQALAELQGAVPDSMLDEAAALARNMIEARFIPSAVSIVVQLIMLAVVTGSALTLCLGALLSIRRRSDANLKTL